MCLDIFFKGIEVNDAESSSRNKKSKEEEKNPSHFRGRPLPVMRATIYILFKVNGKTPMDIKKAGLYPVGFVFWFPAKTNNIYCPIALSDHFTYFYAWLDGRDMLLHKQRLAIQFAYYYGNFFLRQQ